MLNVDGPIQKSFEQKALGNTGLQMVHMYNYYQI